MSFRVIFIENRIEKISKIKFLFSLRMFLAYKTITFIQSLQNFQKKQVLTTLYLTKPN